MSDGMVIDCFAGGGGASQGIEEALGRPCDVAVNHDPKAIAMHKANHPQTHHMTEEVNAASPLFGRTPPAVYARQGVVSRNRAQIGKGGRLVSIVVKTARCARALDPRGGRGVGRSSQMKARSMRRASFGDFRKKGV